MNAVHRLLVSLVLLSLSSAALAQEAIQPYIEYRKRVETSQNISPLDTGLFGEQVSLYNGSTTFSVTDIDVPGHHDLPVQLTRTFSVELQLRNLPGGDYDSMLKGAGNWDVDVPYMAATYSVASGTLLRCDGVFEGPPLFHPFFPRSDVWHGISINVPGRGKTSALSMQTGVPRPAGSATYKLTTTERDAFDCIPMQPGFSGQGFRMTTASGLRYYFDVGASRTDAMLEKWVGYVNNPLPTLVHLERNKLYLLASKIEDRFGNTVQFQYNANGHPTRIWANDGREITLSYTSGRLATATSHGYTWQYQYASSPVSGMYAWLTQVTRPDASTWQYSYSNNLHLETTHSLPPMPWCTSDPPIVSASFTLTATHPSGATGAFAFSNRRHYRSGVHATECVPGGDPANAHYTLLVPHFYDVMSINSKTLGGPGLPSMTWDYEYTPHLQALWGTHTEWLPYPCTTCAESKKVTVINPDDTKSRYTFGIRYHDNDGRQLKVETLRANGTVIRTETNTYMSEAEAATQPFHGVYGLIMGGHVLDPASARIRPVTNRTIQQDGVSFVWKANSFDTMARPKEVTRSSTVAGSPTRTEETTYHDNLAKWVLGQIRKVTCKAPTTALPAGCGGSGVEMFERTYDAVYAMPLVTERFNKPEQTLAWDTTAALTGGQRGTVKTVADGAGHTVTLTSWKRGTPQSIKYPATTESPGGATQSAVVNDHGWVTRVTDENGFATNYTHDAMGRLASIVYPTGDSTAWNTTTQAFQRVATAEYGIPAGHWRQTVSTGNGRKLTYFDAMWRPLLTREYDTANEAGTQRFQRFAYDPAGRTAFASYPASVHNPTQGTWSEYDALGRPTSVSQDSELGLLITLTEYLTGFQTRVTSPKLQQTTTRHLAWDQPVTDFPTLVTHPEGAYTHITRDVFGKPTILRRSNSSSPTGGTVALNRTYAYNASQELCRSVEPETGATLMGYDGAGNLKWSAAGLPAGQACETHGTSPAVTLRRVDRTYDARNRLKTLEFPDGNGDQAWAYYADGLPQQISTWNIGFAGATPAETRNLYTYNKRRLLKTELIAVPAWYTFSVEHGYNPNGHETSLSYPSGHVVTTAVNALGQPTAITGGTTTYASGITWHPNGALAGFTYGNSIAYTMTQNDRKLPALSKAVFGATEFMHDAYAYDGHANVDAITDLRLGKGGWRSRAMDYDGLDRLTSVASQMYGSGGANYTYNVLDDILKVTIGGAQARNHDYCYSTTRRLATVRTGGCGGTIVTSLSYDVQGNLASKGTQGYRFDFGNRLREVDGVERYRYDGHGRRVLAMNFASGTVLSQYGLDGKILYQKSDRTGLQTDQIYLGGSLIAIRELPISGPGAAVVKYQHTDALGSPVVVTRQDRSIVEETEYEPYGQVLNRPMHDGPGYTGHVEDAATGLVQMQQRYYDSAIGRFLSTDPVSPDHANGSNFNRYNYVENNPYRYIDPDGRHKQDKWWGHTERDFQRYVHQIKQDEGRTHDYGKDDLDRLKKEWEKVREQRRDRTERQERRRTSRDQRGVFSPTYLLKISPPSIVWSMILYIPATNESEDEIVRRNSPQPIVIVGEPEKVPDSLPEPLPPDDYEDGEKR